VPEIPAGVRKAPGGFGSLEAFWFHDWGVERKVEKLGGLCVRGAVNEGPRKFARRVRVTASSQKL